MGVQRRDGACAVDEQFAIGAAQHEPHVKRQDGAHRSSGDGLGARQHLESPVAQFVGALLAAHIQMPVDDGCAFNELVALDRGDAAQVVLEQQQAVFSLKHDLLLPVHHAPHLAQVFVALDQWQQRVVVQAVQRVAVVVVAQFVAGSHKDARAVAQHRPHRRVVGGGGDVPQSTVE